MKNILSSLVVFSIIILTLNSCKKDNGNANPGNNNAVYYMRFKLNGIQTEFKSVPICQSAYNSIDKVYVTGILALKDSSKIDQDQIDIAITNKDPLAPGAVYQDPVKVNSGTAAIPQIILTYYNSQQQSYISMGLFSDDAGNFSSFLPDYKNLVANAKLTVSNIGSNYIKGTFSGTVFKLNTGTNIYDKIALTDGEFNLRYKQ
ncbi:MAG TPA: hypothetical protein VLI68_17275 [Hanamia sp.]|jgi:hypothetical protein|nr:hypothetical protein [Hanamia sp.]